MHLEFTNLKIRLNVINIAIKDSMVPPCDRCRYKTDKLPTGAYNRKRLLDFLEKKAREEKDWEEEKPYTKEKRGNAALQERVFCINFITI